MTDYNITIRWEKFERDGQTFMREFWSTSQGHTVYGPIPAYYDVDWWIEQRKALIQKHGRPKQAKDHGVRLVKRAGGFPALL